MALWPAAVLGAAIRQYTKQTNTIFLQHRQHAIIEEICCRDGRLGGVELTGCNLAIRVHKGLLVNPSNPLDRPHIVRVLRSKVAWMFGLYLAIGLVCRSLVLQGDDLGLSKNDTFLGDLLLQCLEAQFPALQCVAQPVSTS